MLQRAELDCSKDTYSRGRKPNVVCRVVLAHSASQDKCNSILINDIWNVPESIWTWLLCACGVQYAGRTRGSPWRVAICFFCFGFFFPSFKQNWVSLISLGILITEHHRNVFLLSHGVTYLIKGIWATVTMLLSGLWWFGKIVLIFVNISVKVDASLYFCISNIACCCVLYMLSTSCWNSLLAYLIFDKLAIVLQLSKFCLLIFLT